MNFFTWLNMRFSCIVCHKLAWRRVGVEDGLGEVVKYTCCLEDEYRVRSTYCSTGETE